jgi:hypothetical protein
VWHDSILASKVWSLQASQGGSIDTEASEETKDRYGFPYGDFSKLYRSALIHAKQRASQNGHEQIEKVAGELLDELDRAASS